MTVLDTTVVIDFLLGIGVAEEARALIEAQQPLAAPDVLVFETLAVLRRGALRGDFAPRRVAAAVEDLGDVAIDLFPALGLRAAAWDLRENLTIGDALFVALAAELHEPLATTDAGLAAAAAQHAGVEVLELGTRG